METKMLGFSANKNPEEKPATQDKQDEVFDFAAFREASRDADSPAIRDAYDEYDRVHLHFLKG